MVGRQGTKVVRGRKTMCGDAPLSNLESQLDEAALDGLIALSNS